MATENRVPQWKHGGNTRWKAPVTMLRKAVRASSLSLEMLFGCPLYQPVFHVQVTKRAGLPSWFPLKHPPPECDRSPNRRVLLVCHPWVILTHDNVKWRFISLLFNNHSGTEQNHSQSHRNTQQLMEESHRPCVTECKFSFPAYFFNSMA